MTDKYRKLKLDEYARSVIVETVDKLDTTKTETENALIELADIQSTTDTNIADIENALIELGNIIGELIGG